MLVDAYLLSMSLCLSNANALGHSNYYLLKKKTSKSNGNQNEISERNVPVKAGEMLREID